MCVLLELGCVLARTDTVLPRDTGMMLSLRGIKSRAATTVALHDGRVSLVLLKKPISQHTVKKAQSRWREGSIGRLTLPLRILQSIKRESQIAN